MAKKRTPSGIIDQLRDYLQELPIRQALGGFSRGSVGRTQRLESELSAEARPKDIAAELGISTQKWVAMRQGIREGRIASPVLGDLLERTTREETLGKPSLASIEYTADIPHKGRRTQRSQIWEIKNPAWIKHNAPWMRDLKPGGFADKKSALNWWGNAGAGSQYFAMVRKKIGPGRYRYHIYDMRTRKELSNKGNQKGLLRAAKLLKKQS